MKKNRVLWLLLLTAVFLTACAGCGGVKPGEWAMPHFDGMNADGKYDSAYFYRNDLTVFGSDAGCIYVPAERSETYGGWFYMYTSGNNGVYTEWYEEDHAGAITVLRSRDLNDWELCGAVDDGFSVLIERGEWVYDLCWAPEVIFDAFSDKYFMYFNARTKEDPNRPSANRYDRFYMAAAVSDTPIGPFRLVTSENVYGSADAKNADGEVITAQKPPVDICAKFNLDSVFPVIDFSPFRDDDGTLYLYFVKHFSSVYDVNSVWCMRMKDMITPDYDTLRMIARSQWESVTYRGGDVWDEESYRLSGPWSETSGMLHEGVVNEGPFVRAHTDAFGVKKYYLTYSPRGFTARNYDVKQAVSDSPLGPFIKLPGNKGTVMGANPTNDYMTGTGHHCFVEAGDETLCLYTAHNDPLNGESSSENGRIYAFDRVSYVWDAALGMDILYGNGPTKSIQPKPAIATGWRNMAGDATVSVTGAVNEDTVKYLTDGLFVSREAFSDWEFRADTATVITLTFNEPREIGAILVYNSFGYEYAFSGLDEIAFELAERVNGYDRAYIRNLGFYRDYVNQESGFMRQGGASLASFRPIKVKSIRIGISKKFTWKNADGSANNEIRISDIVVLGK